MRTSMIKPPEVALRDEQVDLGFRIVLTQEQGGCPHAIVALEDQVRAIDEQLKGRR